MNNIVKVGRNALCSCGSGKKFKHCCDTKPTSNINTTLSPQIQLQISAQLDMALEHQNAMRLNEAEYIYRQVLQVHPSNPYATHLLGLIAHQVGKHELTIDLISKAIALKSNFASAYCNLGLAKQALGKIDDARKHFEKAIMQDPKLIVAYNNYGSLVHLQDKNYEKAISIYTKAINIDPNFAMVYFNLANVYRDLNNYQAARLNLQKVISLAPDFAQAHHNLASVLHRSWCVEEAIPHYRAAGLLDSEKSTVFQDMFVMMQYSENTDEVEFNKALEDFSARFEVPLTKYWGNYSKARDPKQRLKIGYVSADFRNHPVANFIEPVLANHNHQAFEIYCYYNNDYEDKVTDRIKQMTDHWRHCSGLSDEAVAKQIRDDGIDILIDLSGHTHGNRMLTFMRKPAPIQASWMGYVGSTGLKSIDYRFTDALAEPTHSDATICVEKPWPLDKVWYVSTLP